VLVVQDKLQYMTLSLEPINGVVGPHIIFTGCNVHIRSGSGESTDGTVDLATQTTIPETAPLGLGNLVLGYNEQPAKGVPSRGGSHDLIVGPGHAYPSVAGVVFGQQNSATGPLSSVTGGILNDAQGYTTSVSGGDGNTVSGISSSVSGGHFNFASGDYSSVSGGTDNTASGESSSVSAGRFNLASGTASSVSGGYINYPSGNYSSISGGFGGAFGGGAAPGDYDWVAGALFQED